ncbi:fungal-specific transcription factor [Coniochaeta sp. 2T2.1]|nr:fungal-specific transcription factor [Coniochaeta sp. 2T2.1]
MNPVSGDPPPGARNLKPRPANNPVSSGTAPRTKSTGTPLALTLGLGRTRPPPLATGISARPGQESQTVSKHRRGLRIVTRIACAECRKKRAKCDGDRPCGRCRNLGVTDCVYEVPVRQSKENLREEIKQLNRQNRTRDQVLAALAHPDHSDLGDVVLAQLRNGQSVDSISEWLPGALPSGGPQGTLPSTINRPSDSTTNSSGSGSQRIRSYASGTAVSYGLANSPSGAINPVPSRHPHSQRHASDSQSPWGTRSSSHSLATSQGTGSHLDLMNWTAGTATRQRVGTWLDNEGDGTEQRRFHGLEQVLTPEVPEMEVPAAAWTKVTDDSRLVQRLLGLYFCWEYPTFASLSKEHFLRDFQDGRTRYCSSMLVNGLLALGCRFSSHPATCANPDDPYTSGDHFFKEWIMSIREASCGRDSESWYFAGQSIRLTLEMGLQMNAAGGEDDETTVRSATFWGAYSLDLAWCLATGTLPRCSLSPHLPAKPAIVKGVEASLWIPYTDNGAPVERSCDQPSNVRSVYKCFCELSELVHRSLYVLHSPGKAVTSRELRDIYTDYLSWYDQVPDVLRLGQNFTPAVLFAHMYYHFAILQLFRPFIKLRLKDPHLLPRVICMEAADAIQGLSRSYSQLYTLRQTPSFVPYFVLTAAIMHLAIAAESSRPLQALSATNARPSARSSQQPHSSAGVDPEVTEYISRGIADLTEMAPCHHVAEQALNILMHLAKIWHMEIRVKQGNGQEGLRVKDSSWEPASPRSVQGIRPVTDSLNLFVPEVTDQDIMCSWGPAAPQSIAGSDATCESRHMGKAQEKGAGSEKAENPLFWPFPMQGRPIIHSGDKLHEAGFELL